MKPDELNNGKTYFSVVFHDADLKIPEITTYIYIGKNILKNDLGEEDTYYFQGAEAFIDFGEWISGNDAVKYDVMTMKEDFLEYIFDYSGLQEQIEMMKKGGAKYYP